MKVGYYSLVGLFLLVNLSYGQRRLLSFNVNKTSPSIGKEFSSYSGDYNFGMKFRYYYHETWLFGIGIERMNYSKSTLKLGGLQPAREVTLNNVFALAGYEYAIDTKVRLVPNFSIGVSRMVFDYKEFDPDYKSKDRTGIYSSLALSAFVPMSALITVEPEIGYAMVFHKLDGFIITDSKGDPISYKKDGPIGTWVYRFGIGYRF